MARPSKYEDRFCEELIIYFDRKPYEREKLLITKKNGDTEEKYVETPCDFPLIAGFANKIGVSRDTLHEWANAVDKDGKLKHPEFSDSYKKAKQYQEEILVTNGLRGNYQTAFACFTAKNVIGYRDSQELTGKDGSPLIPPVINLVVKGSKSKLLDTP